MLPWGTCDSKVPKEPFKDQSFGGSDNAGTKTDRWHAGGALHAKEKVGRGWSAPGMVQCRGRGDVRPGIFEDPSLTPEQPLFLLQNRRPHPPTSFLNWPSTGWYDSRGIAYTDVSDSDW